MIPAASIFTNLLLARWQLPSAIGTKGRCSVPDAPAALQCAAPARILPAALQPHRPQIPNFVFPL